MTKKRNKIKMVFEMIRLIFINNQINESIKVFNPLNLAMTVMNK